MKLLSNPRRSVGASAVIAAALAASAHAQEVTVEGARDNSGPEGYTLLHTQATATNWTGGSNQSLANIHAKQEAGTLFLHLAAKVDGNACILFIDSKPGGVGFIRNNLITSGGEEGSINNLGTSPTAGLTFENGFEPDYAVRIYGQGTDAYINTYNFATGARTYAGNSGPDTASSAFLTSAKTIWGDVVPAGYANANLGVEMALSLAGMGVPTGSQDIKVMAILVNGNSDYASNQVLGSRTSATTDIGGGINSINFETEADTQTLTFAVLNTDTDNDTIPNDIDDDDDGDGLLDTVETNDGIYDSPTDTGTNPLIADTDGDGGSDGDEVLFNHFGFLSNPNLPNFSSMAIPGSFTDPQWQVDGTGGTDMATVDTTLTGQYQWIRDFRFNTVGPIEYKFAANGSYTNSWGDGPNNITSLISGTGFHTFSFNNATLARSLVRKVFPSLSEYLTAYDTTASGDPDGDGMNSEAEYAQNSDPTQADTDGDGINDATDTTPLAATRDIVFRVDMSVQEALGNFDPETDTVLVDFFTGLAGPTADLPLTPIGNGIWSGTLPAFQGPAGTAFGGYKFRNTRPGAPDSGYEGAINDRNFNLEAANATQTLAIVFFNDITTPPGGYGTWATANAGGQGAAQDFDNDGVANGVEYFMGQTGSTFTANPQIVSGTISWPHAASATGVTYKVWTSENLGTWEDVTASTTDAGGFVTYTPPTTAPKLFIRLEVLVP
jgi:hypothetical protein